MHTCAHNIGSLAHKKRGFNQVRIYRGKEKEMIINSFKYAIICNNNDNNNDS